MSLLFVLPSPPAGADFVHVVDMRASTADSASVQSIDLFGEVTGVAFSPDDAALFVAVTDAVYGQSARSGRVTRAQLELELLSSGRKDGELTRARILCFLRRPARLFAPCP